MEPRNIVADAIRSLRQSYKLTQVELARKAGIPRATLALMESPKGNPSITSVLQVASALGVPIGELLSKSQESTVTLVKRDDMQVTRMDDGRFLTCMLSPANTPDVQLFSIVLQPGCDTRGRPHPKGSLEYFYNAGGGDLVITVNDQASTVHEGELVFFPGNLPHFYVNPGLREVRAFAAVVAGGD